MHGQKIMYTSDVKSPLNLLADVALADSIVTSTVMKKIPNQKRTREGLYSAFCDKVKKRRKYKLPYKKYRPTYFEKALVKGRNRKIMKLAPDNGKVTLNSKYCKELIHYWYDYDFEVFGKSPSPLLVEPLKILCLLKAGGLSGNNFEEGFGDMQRYATLEIAMRLTTKILVGPTRNKIHPIIYFSVLRFGYKWEGWRKQNSSIQSFALFP